MKRKEKNRIREILFSLILCGLTLSYIYFKYK